MRLYIVFFLASGLWPSVQAYNQTPINPLPDINNHPAVTQAVIGSRQPLATWQQICDRTNNPEAAEQAANVVLNHIQNLPAQSVFVPLLKHWQKHRPIATRRADDHGHDVGVYLIAARAAGELNRLLSEQTERYIYALADRQPQKLLTELSDFYQAAHPAITAGIKAALAHLTPPQQQALIHQQLASQQVNNFSTLLAVTLDSPAIQEKIVLGHNVDAKAGLINAWLHNPPASTQWLQILVQQPGPHQIRALSIYRSLQLNQQDKTWLVSLLDDSTLGRTAAGVLGQQADPELMDKLLAEWQHNRSEPLASNLLYALSRNPLGLKMLTTMAPQKSNRLTSNQQQWLQNQLGGNHEK